ncbi:phage integrase [Pseudomonas protegens]|uniref:phage integrase n=1 Tax=Pseudomonas protegens TaxID=380021 RepID=UPI00384A8FF8
MRRTDSRRPAVVIPLGTDLDQAKVEWARLERRAPPKPNHLMSYVFDRYEKEIIPGKSIRTQSDNRKELKQLRRAFENAPIESITPQVIAQYRDARTAKVRANREIALLSHAFTIAREWGLTDKANPCFGVRRNKEKPRDYYAEAVQELKDAMDLAYLTGQRPADVLKIAATDLNNGFLLIGQGKTEKRLRLEVEGVQSGLSAFIKDLQERRSINGIRTSTLITNTSGLRMSQQMLRNRWDDARETAAIKAAAGGDPALAFSIRQFQFKDIRPKAASEIELTHASRLLGHSTEEMTKKVYRRVGEIVKPTK